MLTGGLDPLYRNLLAGAHKPVTRLEVWRAGVRIDTFGAAGLPIIGGDLAATLTSQVSRNLDFTIDESFWPGRDVGGLLAPWGNEIRAYMGIKPGAGVPYWFQVFRGRINVVTLPDAGDMNVECIDRGGDVNDSGFLGPEASQTGNTLAEEFIRLVSDGVEDATFGSFDIEESYVPELNWEWNRGNACDDLASAAGAYWYALANGDYVIRRIPWTYTRTPLLTLRDGPGGILGSAVPRMSREDVFNVVTVIGERADGTMPVYANDYDSNPTSPTYVSGGFGRKSKLINTQAVIDQGQGLSLARDALRQARALTETWTVAMTPDPSVELGDAFNIQARGLTAIVQVLASFNMSLLGDSTMNCSFRAPQPIPGD